MKYKEFKIFDLILLSILAFLSEFLGYYLIGKLPTSFYLSFSFAICIIAMVRWGVVGVVTHVAAGIALVLLKGNNVMVYNIFYEVIANVAICIPFLFLVKKDRGIILSKISKFLLIVGLSMLFLCVAKGFVLYFVNGSFTGVVDFFGSSLLILITNVCLLILLYVTKSQILTDMKKMLTSDCRKQEG